MSILVVGSIALDTVETPYGKVDNALGGSALYFSTAASIYSPVNVVGVVGSDFDFSKIDFLMKRQVNFDGLTVGEGHTFRWGGRYHENVNKRDTLFTQLNVFQNFSPVIPKHYRNSQFVFLANINPDLQKDVLEQINKPYLTVMDTMNFWINGKRDSLMSVLRLVDVFILNNEELEELTGTANLFDGARQLIKEGPKALVVKKGEHGSILITEDKCFLAPAYPVSKIADPTGAGDSFAGGFLGYLSTCDQINQINLRRAVIYGTIIASFTVEDFSFSRLKGLPREEVEKRVEAFREMTSF